ncbi:hypothetical protein KIW84_012698 [Lathyrus oleraceus]|uniref:Uncharacterized protein n=1 Tax=Pisum sativum TaxID=3888 RepID=A0A9D5BIE2_PEA|nr:hypothetical protein KIW84_012698 [Pisum sativum]
MKCVVHLYVDHYVKDIVGINVEEDEQGNIINDEEDEQGDRINVEEAKQGDGINVEQDEQGNGGVNVEEYEQCDGRIIVEDGEQGGVNGKNVCCMDNVMEINYASDELGSNDPNNLDHEKEQRYDKFIVEELGNNYKIKVGLKFLSLDEFTEEIIEWVLNKISINSMWIAKIVAIRMSSSGGVNIRDIIFEIMSNFSVGITMSGAWKDKQIAKVMVEGDATKQYNLL